MRLAQRVVQRLLLALFKQRVTLLLLLVLGVGTAEYFTWRNGQVAEASASGLFPVEVSVLPIQMRDEGQNVVFTLTLKEMNGSRRISMNVNGSEALAIAREKGIARTGGAPFKPTDGPQAYDLMRNAISQIGGRVDRIIVNDADQRGYFAQVIVSNNGEPKPVSARPGDATALALRVGAPIFVEDRVLEQFGTKSAGSGATSTPAR